MRMDLLHTGAVRSFQWQSTFIGAEGSTSSIERDREALAGTGTP